MLERKERADVIVVGAGITGTSVAYHLLEQGIKNVVVLDAGSPASGTSSAGGGFVALWAAGFNKHFTETDLAMEHYGIEFYGRLAADYPIDYRHRGTLFVATSDQGWEEWIAPIAQHPRAPKDARTLDPHEVSALTDGVIAAEAVVGGILHPAGLQMSAGRANRALADEIVARGGEIRTESRVNRLLVTDGRVTGVVTDAGELEAGHVVLAAGAWTNQLLADVGFNIPLMTLVATRAISLPSGVSNEMPTVLVPELSGLWLREHRGGLTYGNGDGYAPLFSLGGSVGDPGQPRREELLERLKVALTPELRKLVPSHDTSVAWWLQGMPCMTPDRHFVAGPVPGVEGLHVLAGDNEAGVTHGPGLGRLLAEMVINGSSDWIDSSAYRPDRFEADAFPTEESIFEAIPAHHH
ncbi:NAD(P)/FAD-dependent oxidoreductase [Arthrobacter sp. HMWF013]|uniref:NAD(P)/FAD-dependent oxidoreductase n=1 Tax=Arthrobacter sp. HMWF013 TaxID=2056849 RepID=UPI000D3338E1|nr:FAD-binding oxidoreductase [Arthrobacter sp. HMWF013]PTT68764.1 hypothetical protein DBR22_05700 [Arthrobacter sp. HMWF013]